MAKISAFNEVKKFDLKTRISPGYMLYRAKWNLAPRLKWVTGFPTHIDIETTNMCNLRCVMCPHGFDDETRRREFEKTLGVMDWELLKSIIDEGSRKGLSSIKLNWRGEPLVAKTLLIKAIKYARDKNVLEIMINSNGMLLDAETSEALILSGLDKIIFSVDGATKETYEKIRRGGDYDRLTRNINEFVNIRKKLGKKTPLIRMQMVKMNENINEVDGFIDLWKDKVDSISFQDYTNRGEDKKRLECEKEYTGRLSCPQIWQRMILTWDGHVVMCCRDWDSEQVIGKLDYSQGRDIAYHWKSKTMNHIRDLHKKGRLKEIGVCKRCSLKETYNWKK